MDPFPEHFGPSRGVNLPGDNANPINLPRSPRLGDERRREHCEDEGKGAEMHYFPPG